MDADASISSDCVPKTSPRTKQNSAQDDSEGDPEAPRTRSNTAKGVKCFGPRWRGILERERSPSFDSWPEMDAVAGAAGRQPSCL
jgi:hypothetical protein